MPTVHHVKARKDNQVVKAGEYYYWWKFGPRFPKQYSKTRPRASQLTTSEFLGAVYSIQEDMDDATPADVTELESLVSEWKLQIEDARDQAQTNFDNMPESLQGGDTGQLLESRVNDCDDWISNLDAIDYTLGEGEELDDKLQEVKDANPGSF